MEISNVTVGSPNTSALIAHRISIVIPFYNRAELLIETLESVRVQSYRNFEVLIIDDGSGKEARDRIAQYLRALNDSRFSFHVRPSQIPKGSNPCRVVGLTISSGQYIKWFDSDDLMKPNLLERQLAHIRHGYDGVFVNCEIWNGDFSVHIKDGWRKLHFSENALSDYVKTRLAWQTGCGLWRTDKIRAIHPFSEQLTNAQEWIFHLKALTSGMAIGVSNEKLVQIRRHEQSISGKRNREYFLNRLKARTLAMIQLIASKNNGKRFIMKSTVNMMIEKGLYRNLRAYAIMMGGIAKIPGALFNGKKEKVNLHLIHD
jgi:glycosyltransferase involved in cell wall biosynthesis